MKGTATVIIMTYILVAETKGLAYNFWALLALEIFGVIFWLSSFAVLADLLASWISTVASASTSSYCYYSYYYCYKKRDLQKRDVTFEDYENIIIVTLAFSVLEL